MPTMDFIYGEIVESYHVKKKIIIKKNKKVVGKNTITGLFSLQHCFHLNEFEFCIKLVDFGEKKRKEYARVGRIDLSRTPHGT